MYWKIWGFLVESNDSIICYNFAKLYKVAHDNAYMDNYLSAFWEILYFLVHGAPFNHIYFGPFLLLLFSLQL